MNPFYQLNYASIALTIILFIVFLARKSYPTISRRIFKYLIAFNCFSAAAEILVVFIGTGNLVLPSFWSQFFLILYYLIHVTLHYLFLYYMTSSIRGYLATKAEKIIFSVIYCGLIVFLLTNPVHHLAFNFDAQGKFVYSIGTTIFEACSGISLFYALILAIKHKKSYNKLQFSMQIFFLLMWIASILFETFVSHFYVENFTITVTVLLLTIISDNPEKYFVENTTVYNELTFNMVYYEKFQNNIPFKLVCFNYEDFDLYIQKVGYIRARVAITETLKNCKKEFGQQNVFLLSRNVIAIDARAITGDIGKTCEELATKCYQGGLQFNPDLKLEAQFAVFNCPQDCLNISDLHTGINMMLFNPENRSGNLVENFNVSLLDARHRREKIVLKLHEAIENDGFEMYYQPLYDWKKDKHVGLEALIRFKQTDDDFISPGEFIPIAEEDGLIFQIDEIVFEKVCRFIRNTDIKRYGIEFVDINLSLLKLLDPGTVDRYSELASRYEVDPSFLNLEITETAEANEKYLNVVRANISKFRERGFNFSLDDYGSGYSTVVYMAEMDAKIVKIDASILWNAMKNKKYYTVLENCVRLIYCFDKDCVCEGVEDEKMANVLKRLGVDFFQGYYYSKPLNQDAILELLAKKNNIGGVIKSHSKIVDKNF